MPEKKTATLKDIMDFFGLTPKEFTPMWKFLNDGDKADLKSGLGSFYNLAQENQAKVLNTRTLSQEHKVAGVLTY